MKKFITAITATAVCVTLAVGAAGCNRNPAVETVVDAAKPVIISQPADIQLRKGEETRGLEVKAYSADNGSLSYQWYGAASDANSGGTAIDGADKSVLTVDTSTAGISYYYCIVTNTNVSATGAKTAAVTSDPATVRVSYSAEQPRIVEQPKGSNYVFGAQNAALPLSVEAAVSRGELTYQWYVSDEGTYEDSVEIDDATDDKYVPDISNRGLRYYYCEITNTDDAATDGKTAAVRTKLAGVSIDYDFGAFTFEEIDDNTCKLIKYDGTSLYPYIPDTDSEGRAVVEIGKGVFANSPIVEITIPDTVITLGSSSTTSDSDGVFFGCTALRKINFGGKFKFIGNFTFSKCASLSADFWDYCSEAEVIGNGSFQYTNLPEILVMPAEITRVGDWIYQHCKGVKEIRFAGNKVTKVAGSTFTDISTLEKITFPASVTNTGDCLKQCPNLKSVTFERSRAVDGSITSGVPFSGEDYSDTMVIHVPGDSYDAYCASLGSYAKYVAVPPPVEYTLTIEGATIDGESSLSLVGGATLDADASVVYDDEENCLGWVFNGGYFASWSEVVASFKMSYANATLKAVYDDDFTQVFTPCCRTENMGNSSDVKMMNHEKVGELTGTRLKWDTKTDIKIINGESESHGEEDGVYNDCPVSSVYKSCILLTFVNNSDEAITVRYEAEYWGVIGSVTVTLAAHETKTALLVESVARATTSSTFHQFRIVEGGDNGFDITVVGRMVA